MKSDRWFAGHRYAVQVWECWKGPSVRIRRSWIMNHKLKRALYGYVRCAIVKISPDMWNSIPFPSINKGLATTLSFCFCFCLSHLSPCFLSLTPSLPPSASTNRIHFSRSQSRCASERTSHAEERKAMRVSIANIFCTKMGFERCLGNGRQGSPRRISIFSSKICFQLLLLFETVWTPLGPRYL